MDINEMSVADLLRVVRQWSVPFAFVLVGLFAVVGGSKFGFDVPSALEDLLFVFAGAVIALASCEESRKGSVSRYSFIVGATLAAAILGFLVSAQSGCVRGSGGREPTCDELQPLSRNQARDNTTLGVVVLLGIAGASLAGAIAGRQIRD